MLEVERHGLDAITKFSFGAARRKHKKMHTNFQKTNPPAHCYKIYLDFAAAEYKDLKKKTLRERARFHTSIPLTAAKPISQLPAVYENAVEYEPT